jgi:hypothetical protein
MGTSLFRYAPACIVGFAALVGVALSGCSDTGIKRVTIKGTIAYKGQPLSSGMLQFAGQQGAYSAASIQQDGTFIITDVLPGEVKVGVMDVPRGSGSSSGAKTGPRPAPVVLPEKYRDPQKSGVTYTITPETRELTIALE